MIGRVLEDGDAGEVRGPARSGARRRPGRSPGPRDLQGLRVVVDGRGPLGGLVRTLGAVRGLVGRGADALLVDTGLRPRVLQELRRRWPELAVLGRGRGGVHRLVEGAAAPPRQVLHLAPDVTLGHRDALELVQCLVGSARGVALVPRPLAPCGEELPVEAGFPAPAWIARGADLAEGRALTFRPAARARVLVERPASAAGGALAARGPR